MFLNCLTTIIVNICKTYTISSANTWEQKKLIFDNETSNTLGNDNGKSLELQFYLSCW